MCSITPTWRSKSRNKNRYVFWNKNPLVALTQREDPEDSTNSELWIIWMWRAHRIICLIESAISLNKSDIDSEFESWWIHSSSAFRWLRFANCHYGPRDWPSTKMCQTIKWCLAFCLTIVCPYMFWLGQSILIFWSNNWLAKQFLFCQIELYG